MVEIIPYTEDDEDSSTWVPLSAPDTRSSHGENTTTANAAKSHQNSSSANHHLAYDESDSEWQELNVSHASLAPVTTSSQKGSRQTSTSDSSTSWWGKQLITHLTKTPQGVSSGEEGDYSSENDEEIVWKRANDLNADDKILFRRVDNDDAGPSSSNSREKGADEDAKTKAPSEPAIRKSERNSSRANHNQQRTSIGSTQHRNQQGKYRQQAKNKLQQTLLYHPMRELPFCILRNLYVEGKHELYMAWNAYIEANGGNAVFAPITFFIAVGLLGIALIATGVFKIGYIALYASVRFTVAFMKFVVVAAWGMTTRLAWISLISTFVLGVLVYVVIVKVRKASNARDKSWIPNMSNLLTLMIAVASPAMYELIAILYSFQALSLSTSNDFIRNDMESLRECDAYSIPMSTTFSTLIAWVVAIMVMVLTCCGVSAFAEYLDNETDMNSTKNTVLDSTTHNSNVLGSFASVKRHLIACHTLSVAIFVLSAISFIIARAIYLYYGGELMSILSGLGTVGFNFLFVVVGALLVNWSGKLALRELPNIEEGEDSNLYQRIVRNALKESVIDITTNAVWGNVSGISGVLSEEDGILRLAVLEWLIDRWTSSSETTENSSSQPTTSTSTQEESNPSDSSQADAKSDKFSSPGNQTEDASNCQRPSRGSAINLDISKSLPSYESLEKVISKLDADESLIPAIQSYRIWIYSLPPSRNIALAVGCWRMCPCIVALMLVAVWSILLRMKEALLTISYAQLEGQCVLTTSSTNNLTTIILMSVMIFLEYHRVRRWWTRVACNLSEAEQPQTDSIAIMLEYDADQSSRSVSGSIINLSALNGLVLKTWNMLLESIVMLENAVPVVRCATVAVEAANLTSNAACLVDLAVQIKKHGLLAGLGILVVDAFSHQLQEELRRRHGDHTSDEGTVSIADDLGGKYTSSLIKSVGNASKIVHNLQRIREGHRKSEEELGASAALHEDNQSLSGIVEEKVESTSPTAPKGTNLGSSEGPGSKTNHDEHLEAKVTMPSSEDFLTKDIPAQYTAHEENDTNEDGEGGETPDLVAVVGEVSTTTQNEIIEVSTSDNEEQRDGGLPVWLGGGLAVAGAIAGGLAVVIASGKKEDNKKKEQQQH